MRGHLDGEMSRRLALAGGGRGLVRLKKRGWRVDMCALHM